MGEKLVEIRHVFGNEWNNIVERYSFEQRVLEESKNPYVKFITICSQVFSVADFGVYIEGADGTFCAINGKKKFQQLVLPKEQILIYISSEMPINLQKFDFYEHPKRINNENNQIDIKNIVNIRKSLKYKKLEVNRRQKREERDLFPYESVRFVGIIDNLTGTLNRSYKIMEPRATKTKITVRLQNNGAVKWPETSLLIPTRLKRSHHTHFKTDSQCYPMLRAIEPLEYVDITIPLFIPIACDCYQVSWKMISPLYSFGPTFGISINVNDITAPPSCSNNNSNVS